MVRIGAPVAGSMLGSTINPIFGGVIGGVIGSIFAEMYTSVAESKYTERRLKMIENYVGVNLDVFKDNIDNLTEHEHYMLKKIVRFHFFEVLPELTPATTKMIVSYVIENSKRTAQEQVIEILCQLNAFDYLVLTRMKRVIQDKYDNDYTRVCEWTDFSPVLRKTSKEGEISRLRISDMEALTVVDENDNVNTGLTTEINAIAISYTKLSHVKVISKWYRTYTGMNTDTNIDQFLITPFGKQILEYIDLENDESDDQIISLGLDLIKLGDPTDQPK